MELRHIRYFLVLAEELNFTRAAERLHIAQPPLSRQIQELESEIGSRLFYRTKRHVELTNAGKVFLNRAYQILDQVEQACISTRLSSTGQEGDLRIGFSGIVHDIIPTLQKYRERYPQVGIILQQMSSTAQIEALNEKRIDIGLVTTPFKSNIIEAQPFKKVRFMIALPERHPLSSKEAIYIRDLADETFIITPKSVGPLYYEMFMSVFQYVNFMPKITIQAHDLHTVIALVAGGMGVSLAPLLDIPVSGIIKRNVEDINLAIPTSLVWRKDIRSELLDTFLTYLDEFLSS